MSIIPRRFFLPCLLIPSLLAIALPVAAQTRVAVLGEQTTHSLHRQNDPEYPRFLGEALDADFVIDETKPHPDGGGHLYGSGTHYMVGNFGHPRGTVLDHDKENPRAIIRSEEFKLAEQFAPQVVVLGPFGDHEPLTGVSMDNFSRDLRALLARIGEFSSHPRILVALPLPRSGKDEDDNYRRIRQETEQVARALRLPVIDLWTPFLDHAEFFQDASHLTVPGRRELARIVAAAIRDPNP